MFTNCAVFKCVIENREYFYICENAAPLPHSKEALFYFQKCMGRIEDYASAEAEKLKAEQVENAEPIIEEVKPEA
jgi:hypothetical protein